MKKFLKLFLTLNHSSITIYVTVLILVLFTFDNRFLNMAELKTIDLRFRYRGQIKPTAPVVMAVIDEKSLDQEGKWPWPRAKMAALIDRLSEDGAKVIAFDVFFSEPDINNNLLFIRQLEQRLADLKIKNKQLGRLIEENKIKADNDRILAEAMRHSKAKVVLGFPFYQSPAEFSAEPTPTDLKNRLRLSENAYYPVVRYANAEAKQIKHVLNLYAPEPNIEVIGKAAGAAGYIMALPEEDGTIRSYPLLVNIRFEGENHCFMPLSLQALRQYLDQPPMLVNIADYGIDSIRLGDLFIQGTAGGKMYINYLGPENTFASFSVTDILHGKIEKGAFKNKIVLVGSTALGAHDLRVTPFSGSFPGMEIHANIIDNILAENFLSEAQFYYFFGILAVLLISLLQGLFIPRLNAVKGILFACGLFIFYILLAQYLFSVSGTLINVVYPSLTLFLIYTTLTTYHYFTEERRRRQLKNAFVCYVSSSVVNEIIKDPDKLKLGGDKRELTVLFSDIRGFTTLTEKLQSEELVALLNEYLTLMTNVVFKYEGTLDKYIGDALMAFYGAPQEQPDHAHRACHTALEMFAALKELNRKWIQEGKKTIDIGIGINTGPMMVGNMGSKQRFDYTVIGDAVNLGSRLEGINKDYGSHILISESTYAKIKTAFTCLELDSVRVKGKLQSVKIYQLIGAHDISAEQKQAVNRFHEGLALFRNRQWDQAIEAFKAVQTLDRELGAAQIYIKRAESFKADPPPPDWDASVTMTMK
ncbi:MAG: adenylate/guanylate cyclase domain-containing protein [Desulfobacteraceae bacterium]|nr:MAG: adenylate/guanylate cyclase domain-containing protein [Desulfobacteraceae bacterium]